MALNPCCCSSLQTGVKAVSIFGMIRSILLAALTIFGMVYVMRAVNNYETTGPQFPPERLSPFMVASIISIIIQIAYFGMSIFLFKAAQNRNARHSKIWLIVTAVLWALTFLRLLENSRHDTDGIVSIIVLVHLLLEIYFIWVVYAFRKETLEQESRDFALVGGGERGKILQPSANYTTEP